jgi:hypothetical protein
MGREDIDVSQEMQRILSEEGIQVLLEAELLQVRGQSGEKVDLVVRTASGEQNINGSDILVAIGRVSNTAGIGLKEAGVRLDSRGYVRVNGRLETSAPDVWAMGECAGSPQFTHISEDDFRIIRDNLAGRNRSTRGRLVSYCMFTDPPLAHVGLSEGEAERQGIIVRVARLPMNSVLGAQATERRQGFMKALIGQNDDRILGFMMIGAEAGEVMAAVQTAMLARLSYSTLTDTPAFAHPTMAEGLSLLFSNVPPRHNGPRRKLLSSLDPVMLLALQTTRRGSLLKSVSTTNPRRKPFPCIHVRRWRPRSRRFFRWHRAADRAVPRHQRGRAFQEFDAVQIDGIHDPRYETLRPDLDPVIKHVDLTEFETG